MALKKHYKLRDTGISGEYWRITMVIADFTRNFVQARLDLYVNQQARIDGKLPIASVHAQVEKNGDSETIPRGSLYGAIKQLDFIIEGSEAGKIFEDAEDLI